MKKTILITLVGILLSFTLNAQVSRYHVGSSQYDLQTNNSIERRIVVDPVSKKIIATFTGSKFGDGTYADRGTGYAYFDGMTWKNKSDIAITLPYDSFHTRPEDKRVGWPNPMMIGGGEAIITHISDGGFNGLYKAHRATVGTGPWLYQQVTTGAETWPRAASSGNNIVILSSHFQADFNGVPGGLMYVKSTNGGTTWSQPDSIPGINADNYTGVGGDNYHIDIKGDTIAILTGVNDVTLYKSTNMGATWTKKSFIPTSENFNTVDLGRADRSDGSYSVLIGNDGTVHCFWGRASSFIDPTGSFIDLTRSGIMYWNETMGTKEPIVMPRTDFFRENNNSPMTCFSHFNKTTTAGSQINYFGGGSGYNMNTSTWPSSGTDAAGNIYMTYAYNRGKIDTTNTGPGKDADKNGFNLHDIMVMKSMDGGTTWIGPLNISSTPTLESTFPSMARYVDDSVTVIWQEDSLYGNAVITVTGSANGTGSQAGPIHTNNKQMVAKVAVNGIINPATDITPPILMFKNSFLNTLSKKSLTNAILVVFKGCLTDTVTGKPLSATKKFLIDNIVEFRDDVSGMDTNFLFVDSLSKVNLNVPGLYILNIWAKDAAGNLSKIANSGLNDTLTIGIEVLDDVVPPTIVLNGNDPMVVYNGTSFTDPGAVVSDNYPCGSPSYSKSGTVNTSVNGTYTITYNSTDLSSLTTTITRKVVVGVEPTAVITAESLVSKVLKGNGATSLNVITDANTTFKWTVKKTNASTSLANTLGSTQNTNNLNYTLAAGFPAFDSLCLEVKSDFNTTFTKPVSKVCKFLQYTLGVNSTDKTVSVDIYPNPSNGTFNVKVNGNKSNSARFIITSIDGKTVLDNTVKINNNEIPFNTPIAKGLYFMSTEVDGNVYLDKIEIK